MRIKFVFVGEGVSDEGLKIPLTNLCIRLGATEVESPSLDYSLERTRISLRNRSERQIGRELANKLVRAYRAVPDANLMFIHRDADQEDQVEHRISEIEGAVKIAKIPIVFVPVVPVQETEAWLLLDEEAIRMVVGNPRGRINLNIPSPLTVEHITSPKEKLEEILLNASEAKGRQLHRVKQRLSRIREQLWGEFDLDGPISQVPAWQRLEQDLQNALTILKNQEIE